MKNSLIALTGVGICLTTLALAQPFLPSRAGEAPIGITDKATDHQVPIFLPVPSTTPSTPLAPEMNDPVIISDALPHTRAISIFAGLTRDITSVVSRFDDAAQNTTVLAPSNTAMIALPRKPWEDADEYSAMGGRAYEGQDGQERANANVKRFVQAHVVPRSPWREGEKVRTLLGGQDIWWEAKEGGVKVVSARGR